jgi:hypothetical protein
MIAKNTKIVSHWEKYTPASGFSHGILLILAHPLFSKLL